MGETLTQPNYFCSGFSSASSSVRSMFREDPNYGIAPLLPKAQSLQDESDLDARVYGSEVHILRTSSGGMMIKQRNPSQKITSWVKKRFLGKVPRLAMTESKATALSMIVEYEESEHYGEKRTIKYTMAPAKPREFHGTPQFVSITPQQAAALYAKKYASNVVAGTNSAGAYPLTVRQAIKQHEEVEKLPIYADELSQNVATVGASKSFEDDDSLIFGTEVRHGQCLLSLPPMRVNNLPAIS